VETLNVEPVNDVMDEGGPQFPGPMPGPGQRPSFQNQFGPGRRGPNPPPFGGFAPRAEPPPSHSTNFLSEKQFRVSMLIQVVKPHPAGSSPAATAGHATAAR